MKALVLFLALLAGTGEAAAETARPDAPQAVVRRLMDFAEKGQSDKLVHYGPATPPMRKLFTRGFVADWEKAMTYNSEEPVFDADIFDGEQGSDGSRIVTLWTEADTGQAALVLATLKTSGEDKVARLHDQSYLLLKDGGDWKIEEIVYQSKQPAPSGLHASLRQTIASHRQPGAAPKP
jgi:hypothetical protein